MPCRAYLDALTDKGVDRAAVIDYLARYQSEKMIGRIHRFLGLEMGVILAGHDPEGAPAAAVRRGHHLRH